MDYPARAERKGRREIQAHKALRACQEPMGRKGLLGLMAYRVRKGYRAHKGLRGLLERMEHRDLKDLRGRPAGLSSSKAGP
jgi:hypothetical protein